MGISWGALVINGKATKRPEKMLLLHYVYLCWSLFGYKERNVLKLAQLK